MALSRASHVAASAFYRAAAGVRSMRRAVVRGLDARLYGLDQEYPEYDAYQRRPRRIARAIGRTVLAGSVATVTTGLRGVRANRWARPHSDTRSATPRHRATGVVSRADGRIGRARRVELRGVDPASGTDLPTSSRSDVSDPPGSLADPQPIPAESAPAASQASGGIVINATTPDTRHTSAIPSTFAPGAA